MTIKEMIQSKDDNIILLGIEIYKKENPELSLMQIIDNLTNISGNIYLYLSVDQKEILIRPAYSSVVGVWATKKVTETPLYNMIETSNTIEYTENDGNYSFSLPANILI